MLLIHDFKNENIARLNIQEKVHIINANDNATHCVGCFNCWLKNKGYCFMNDSLKHIGKRIGENETIIIISALCYGSYSPNVKKVIDRSISTSLAFFTYRKGKTHHISRYSIKPKLMVIFYGKSSDFEKETATEFVHAHSVNLNASKVEIIFDESKDDVLGGFLNEYFNA